MLVWIIDSFRNSIADYTANSMDAIRKDKISLIVTALKITVGKGFVMQFNLDCLCSFFWQFQRFVCLRIRQQAYRQNNTERHTNQNDPALWLLPFCQIPYPSGGVSFAECQRGTGKEAISRCQIQKGCGVIRPDIFSVFPDHGFIAAHLHIPAGQYKSDPHQRVEPVNRQCQEPQSLEECGAAHER